MSSPTADLAIIGGGIVGCATAYRYLQRFPGQRVQVFEKEARLGAHQTGHNSGVLHSGIYYRPGSIRAQICRTGQLAMVEFCREQGIAHDVCGKVIVATDETQFERLQSIFQRGQANGVRCELIGRERLLELEPHCAGLRAIHVPDAGIADFGAVCTRLGELIRAAGGEVLLSAGLSSVEHRSDAVVLRTANGEFAARRVVTCAGLQADPVTRMTGEKPAAPIVPFRGEYYKLKPHAEHLCRNLIYPVPDPRFPFLGVHFTRMARGGVECGPNAVLALAREGYSKLAISPRDLMESMTNTGLLKLAARYWRVGLDEVTRSFSKSAFTRALQQLVPAVRSEDLEPAPAGIRAQALGPDGNLIDDFVIQHAGRVTNVGNAPSPAATASLQIGTLIVDQLN
ncbi:MAG: L-2-hydroxyglutarate oxidase [Planctomycetaceae bacterium]|nr:L-2-hydroxyglutarate oxidase [Planctomycetaceae bacterium]